MNTIIKAAVVAAGLAFGGVASAAAIPTEGLFFSAFDTSTGGSSIVINLGVTTTDFRSNTSSPYTLSGDGLTALQSWLSTADVSSIWWNVAGASDDGSAGALPPTPLYGGLATSTNIETSAQDWGSFTGLDSSLTNFSIFRNNVNPNLAGSNAYVADGSAAAAFFINQNNGPAFESRAGVGAAMPFYSYFADQNESFFSGDYSVLGGEWLLSFANNTASLVYSAGGAPVPLPAAAWLLLSGLAGLVGVARRKTAA